MSFHSHSDWYWKRLTDGGVLVTTGGGEEHTLTAEAWASIVASVSKRGEDNGRFYDALAFHGKDVPA